MKVVEEQAFWHAKAIEQKDAEHAKIVGEKDSLHAKAIEEKAEHTKVVQESELAHAKAKEDFALMVQKLEGLKQDVEVRDSKLQEQRDLHAKAMEDKDATHTKIVEEQGTALKEALKSMSDHKSELEDLKAKHADTLQILNAEPTELQKKLLQMQEKEISNAKALEDALKDKDTWHAKALEAHREMAPFRAKSALESSPSDNGHDRQISFGGGTGEEISDPVTQAKHRGGFGAIPEDAAPDLVLSRLRAELEEERKLSRMLHSRLEEAIHESQASPRKDDSLRPDKTSQRKRMTDSVRKPKVLGYDRLGGLEEDPVLFLPLRASVALSALEEASRFPLADDDATVQVPLKCQDAVMALEEAMDSLKDVRPSSLLADHLAAPAPAATAQLEFNDLRKDVAEDVISLAPDPVPLESAPVLSPLAGVSSRSRPCGVIQWKMDSPTPATVSETPYKPWDFRSPPSSQFTSDSPDTAWLQQARDLLQAPEISASSAAYPGASGDVVSRSPSVFTTPERTQTENGLLQASRTSCAPSTVSFPVGMRKAGTIGRLPRPVRSPSPSRSPRMMMMQEENPASMTQAESIGLLTMPIRSPSPPTSPAPVMMMPEKSIDVLQAPVRSLTPLKSLEKITQDEPFAAMERHGEMLNSKGRIRLQPPAPTWSLAPVAPASLPHT